MKCREKNKKGISLIVLVITVIVIIILAAAVILSINNNNPIENAKKAKETHNESVYQEELELYAMNEYSNRNSDFNKDTFNVFDGEEVKKIITSMLDEDKGKHIIWQGKLAKKDGEVYKYVNGEEVKVFGTYDVLNKKIIDQVSLTVNMVDFATAFINKQEELKKAGEDPLLYSIGYITNCGNDTVLSIKNKLPGNVEILTFDGKTPTDTHYIATDYQIKYNNEVVAKCIFYGDVNRLDGIDVSDTTRVYSLLRKQSNLTIGQIISADTDHNGVINELDADMISNHLKGKVTITHNSYPIIPKINHIEVD